MKKKLSFWERILGFYNESRHRVICLFGLKIRVRSKYLMLKQQLEMQKQEIVELSHVLKMQKQEIVELSHVLKTQKKEIIALQQNAIKINKLDDLLTRLRSLEKTRGERGKLLVEINSRMGGMNMSLQALHRELESNIAQQDKRIDLLRRESAVRANNMARETNYKIWKYMSPDRYPIALSDRYYQVVGQRLNLDNPQTYNEKIQWMKLYDSTPTKTRLADKYLVRDWVAERIGVQYLIPLLGVWDSFDEIDFDALPERFVLKCNHGCGYNLIVKNKAELNMEDAKRKINTWLREDFAFRAGFELHYSPIPRKIIAEEFIENKDSGDLFDYKFWCFNGKVEYIQFLSERNISGLKMAFYDRSWVKQNFVYSFPLDEKTRERPENLEEMIKVAERLAAGFNHVRVDLYRMDDGRIYFGEMTFTSASGCCNWQPAEMDYTMGQILQLPIKE